MRSRTLLAALAVVAPSFAFWRMECRGRSGLARLDPLMSPDEISQHVHTIHGSSGFSENVTYSDLINADCTSCAVTQDKSAYWTPAVYFKFANGSYELVQQVGGMLAYYFLDQTPGETNITAFPENFRMIAGNSLRRNYTITSTNGNVVSAFAADPDKSSWASLGQTTQNDLEQRAIGFNCLDYSKTPEGSLMRHYLPSKSYLDANCTDGIRIELMFPSCWNGVDTDSDDHKSHVAYPDLVMEGDCPTGFETRLPGLFYETIWNTYAYVGIDGEFVIANGDVEGFGYHGDFIMGWPSQTFLQEAVNTCTDSSGMISDCPLFSVVAESVQTTCSIDLPAALATEAVSGIVGDSLPGGVVIQYGPGEAVVGGNTVATYVPVPTVEYSAGVTVTSGAYIPGGIFYASSSTPTPTPTSSNTPAMAAADVSPTSTSSSSTFTTTSAPTTTAAPTTSREGMSYSTEYVTYGNVVSEIIWEQDVVTVTVEDDVTVTVTATAALKARHLGHRHEAHLARHALGKHGRPMRV